VFALSHWNLDATSFEVYVDRIFTKYRFNSCDHDFNRIHYIRYTMSEKIEKEKKDLKVSLGLLVGYLIAGFVNMIAFEKSWQEAFSDQELVFGFAGILLSVLLIMRLRRKAKTAQDE